MAGSFGYEASHYEVSMQMAELSLLPAVRAQPDAIVVADGTSCRHQIHDGAQREAVHLNQLLAGLQDSLNELAVEAGRIVGNREGEPGVLVDGLVESLHVLLLTLQDAVRSGGPDDLAVLQALTGDRSELMHSIRSRLLAATTMDGATREALLSAISLFERLVWLLRRYALLLAPAAGARAPA